MIVSFHVSTACLPCRTFDWSRWTFWNAVDCCVFGSCDPELNWLNSLLTRAFRWLLVVCFCLSGPTCWTHGASMIGELREQVQVYGENSGACCLYNHGRYSTSWAFSERILDGGALVGTFFACVSWLDGRFFKRLFLSWNPKYWTLILSRRNLKCCTICVCRSWFFSVASSIQTDWRTSVCTQPKHKNAFFVGCSALPHRAVLGLGNVARLLANAVRALSQSPVGKC